MSYLQFQAEHSDGAVLALVLSLIDNGFAGWNETAFFHYAAAGRIVREMAAYERPDVRGFADMLNHKLESLRAYALVPIWLCDPVTGKGLTFACRKLAIAGGAIAHCANGFSCLLEFYSPCVGGVTENRPDYLQTFFD